LRVGNARVAYCVDHSCGEVLAVEVNLIGCSELLEVEPIWVDAVGPHSIRGPEGSSRKSFACNRDEKNRIAPWLSARASESGKTTRCH